MSTDLDQFKSTFITEAYELLGDMEDKLLALESGSYTLDDINAIFRCAHSIKGGGGSFGFDRLVKFTHVLEFLLDGLRSEEIAVSEEVTDALLKSVDVVTTLVDCAKNSQEAPDGFEAELCEILKDLSSAKGGVDSQKQAAVAQPAKVETAFGLFDDEDKKPTQSSTPKRKIYEITFKPYNELFINGSEPLFLIRELKKNAEITVEVDTSNVPVLEDLHPMDCYFMVWKITAKTFESLSVLKETFEFVEDECEISFKEIEDDSMNDADGAWGLFDDDDVVVTSQPQEDASGAWGLFGDDDTSVQSSSNSVNNPDVVAIKPVAKNAPQKQPNPAEQKPAETVSSIRVDIDKIDRMVNMVGELVITQAMIMQRLKELPEQYLQRLMQGVSELARHTRELQEAVMSVRMQPVKSVFSRMPRVVRDIARKLEKEIRLEMKGEATEIDKTVIELLADPLTHMIRNSVDHGIETPAKRIAAGKNPEGVINLTADSSGGRIIIEISDDGAGINREKVLAKSIEKGLVSPDANLTPEEIDNLIFLPGFSTADKVTDVSGRGVGMDVVRKNIKDLGGQIQLTNNPGFGSSITISLPLTLAILDGMIVEVASEKYILPINSILETMQIDKSEVKQVKNNSEVINVRGEFIPIVHVGQLFNITKQKESNKLLVVLAETGRNKVGLVVDELLGQQQVVIKNLEENSDPVEGISGATILGDGNVSLIIDVAQIYKMCFGTGLDFKNAA